jgi:hypothetical protein
LTIAKILPLVLLIGAGIFAIAPDNLELGQPPALQTLARSSILLVFAYAGIESALVPSGEASRLPNGSALRSASPWRRRFSLFDRIGAVNVTSAGGSPRGSVRGHLCTPRSAPDQPSHCFWLLSRSRALAPPSPARPE